MDRREFLLASRRKTKQAQPTFSRTASGIAPYNGAWTINEAEHLLKRTMFGAKKADVDYFLTRSVSDAVDELLNTVSVPAPPLRDYGLLEDIDGNKYDDLGVPQGQTWVNDPNLKSDVRIRGAINGARRESLKRWWMGVIINQQQSIQEKMVLFWHHHYSVQESEVQNSEYLYRHHNLLRTNALGNIKKLARDVTIDPAMLIHLNGHLNSKLAPDENYARELQELFTIGKDITPGFTENDVIAAARVLSGWRIDTNPLRTFLALSEHDTDPKSFSSFYNNTTIAGSASEFAELDALINMIFSNNEASRFMARKIYRWFVYYDIDEATEINVIEPLAAILRNNNYEIKPMLSALLKSEHFFDVNNQCCYIKTPIDFIVGTLREFNVNYPAYTNWQTGYGFFNSLYSRAGDMQMILFQPPDVSGWPSYHQDPMFYELWVNSNSLPRRADYTNKLIEDNVLDLKAFASYSSNPSNPDQLISDVTALLLRYPLSDNSRNYVKTKFLLNNTTDNSIWTNAWNSNNAAVINPALKEMFTFLLNLPEYHLC
ncbi:MAG: DUF1800 domain-containing protein [Chitinophagaceae bacterium]|nr:DUF1800 domain-containing protein [Chitinophagaceae bacterium]